LPLVSEVHDRTTSLVTGSCTGCTYASTSHTTWHLKQLYQGRDGRVVRYAYASQSDAYGYETSPFAAATTAAPTPPTDVECEWDATLDVSSPLTLRSAVYAHTRSQTPSVDAFGNTLHTTQSGCVDGSACSGADEVFDSFASYALPTGDTTGWSWRQVHSWTQGSAHTTGPYTKYDEHSSTYDPLGRLLTTSSGELSGTQALARFHQVAGAAVASAPSNASHDSNVATTTEQPDTYGNVTMKTGPGGRCSTTVLDTAYAQLPVVQTGYAGPPGSNGCGTTQLVSTAAFDRGFGVATYTQDPLLQPSMTVLDGFGRVVQVWGPNPDPTKPGQLAAAAHATVAFSLGSPYSTVVTQVQNGASANVAQYATSWSFVDGMGRTLASLSQADPSAGDGGNWIVSPSPSYDAKGAVQTAYLPFFFTGAPSAYPLNTLPTTGASRMNYDAFGRTIATSAPNGDPTQTYYHPMSTEAWDAEDLKVGGPHYGTFASSAVDGHGRTAQKTEWVRVNGALESHSVLTQYSPSGQPEVVTRTTSKTGAAPVVRTMTYDSWGRLVLNVDTTATWRYAYDDAGEIVGTSDSRGCGKNVFYDTAGRELAEDYSPCLATHLPYTAPNLATGDGTEVYNVYDVQDPDAANAGLSPLPMYWGRLASVSDRGAKTIPSYDMLGRVVQVAKKVAAPGAPAATLASRYASHWWTKSASYDAADRVVSATTGAEELLGTGGSSVVSTNYSARGLPATIAGAYGTLIAGSVVDADGRPLKVTYGDAASTSTAMQYDPKRRLVSACTAPASATGCPTGSSTGTGQGTLSYFAIGDPGANNGYDGADNPLSIQDLRNPAEWTAGAMPVSRTMQYDDLYRLTSVAYTYPGGPDAWTDPFAFEDGGGTAPRLAQPSPHVSFAKRVGQQTYTYDWLGNSVSSGDDANGFYDRSLGAIVNGGASPYQLTSASNVSTGGSATGHLGVAYDANGGMVGMALARNGPCLPSTASCNQRFVYDWDEIGQMARARRWDGDSSLATDPVPSAVPAVDLSYTYGSAGRVLKVATDAKGNELATVYVFSGLELRRAQYLAGSNDYDRSVNTEVVDLGLARLSYEPNAPSPSNSPLHVLLRVNDMLGSSSVLVDKETGKLAEARTYLAYGETESDYRPASFAGVRDDVAFTGKEEDVEVGLQYFGARYLVPALGRWASADPLATHALGADLNEYAYVHGRVYAATDPNGLDCAPNTPCSEGKSPDNGPPPSKPAEGPGQQVDSGSKIEAPPPSGSDLDPSNPYVARLSAQLSVPWITGLQCEACGHADPRDRYWHYASLEAHPVNSVRTCTDITDSGCSLINQWAAADRFWSMSPNSGSAKLQKTMLTIGVGSGLAAFGTPVLVSNALWNQMLWGAISAGISNASGQVSNVYMATGKPGSEFSWGQLGQSAVLGAGSQVLTSYLYTTKLGLPGEGFFKPAPGASFLNKTGLFIASEVPWAAFSLAEAGLSTLTTNQSFRDNLANSYSNLGLNFFRFYSVFLLANSGAFEFNSPGSNGYSSAFGVANKLVLNSLFPNGLQR
jgi:RHS repeat-associated protein